MSFRHKLSAAFLSLLAAILGASLWTVDRVETRRAQDELRSGLERTRDAFDDRLRERDDELARDLTLLSGDFAFKQAIATGDKDTVLSAALNHKARMGADALIVTDGEGALLADTRGRKAGDADWKKRPYIAAALRGQPAKGIFMLDGAAYQLAAIAIDPPDAIGVVVAGFQIDDRFAQRLKKTTLSDVTFLAAGELAGTTLEPHFHDAIAEQSATLSGEPRQILLGSERFLASSIGSDSPVTAVLMRSLDKACEPLRALQRLLLTIGLVGLAATALLGLGIAAGITRSLEQLARAAGKIAVGQYDIALNIPSRDEIGRLGEAFTSMAKGLVEREKIRSILHKSVSKEIAESLVSQGKIELGGEEKQVTVLFSDIRSFTTLSESLSPKDLVVQLNEYFTGMARAIDAQHGVIDKYIGDAVMALFGAPLAGPQDPANALRAALGMVKALDELNERRQARGLAPLKNGIGVNTGPVVAGTLGSEERWSYTVIGDAVNVASRLEGVTKDYGVRIIVSAKTKELAGDGFIYRPLERVTVKGKTESLEIFELVAER